MAETLKSFGEGVERVMNRSKSIDDSLTHASGSVLDMLKSLAGIHLIQKSIETLMNNSNLGKSISRAFNTAKIDAEALRKNQHQALRDYTDWQATVVRRIRLHEITAAQAKMERADHQATLGILGAQVEFKRELSKLSKGELIATGTFLATITSAYNVFTQTGRILIESNATLADRLRLTQSILNVQRQLGSDMNQSAEAARDLVDYGYDLDAAFESTLKLVVQMKDGLGLSTKFGAELAVVYERQLRTSARDVADSMARLVNDTSVAADEAGRLAINIGRAVSLLKPGVNADLSAVTELIGRYEGALKSLGGQFGGFEELLTKLTTSEGMLQAGVLGVQSPEFLRSKEATKQVMDSFASYAKSFLGNTQGWERALRLQSLAEMFGTTTTQVNLMIRAVEEQNNQRQSSITVEQRYKDQVFATAEVVNRLRNSLVALAQQAVLPLIEIATKVLRPIAEGIGYLQKSSGAVYVGMVVMAGAGVAAAFTLYKVTTAFYTMATAAHIAAQAVTRQAAANAAAAAGQLMLPGMGGAGATTLARTASTIGRFIGLAAGPLLAAALGVSVGLAIRGALEKRFLEFKQTELKTDNQELFQAAIKRYALANDLEGVRNSMEWAQRRFTADGMRPDVAAAKIARMVGGLDEMVGEMRFTKASAQHSLGVDPGFDESMTKMSLTQAELIKIASAQHSVALESVKVQREEARKEEEKEQQRRVDSLLQRSKSLENINIFKMWGVPR